MTIESNESEKVYPVSETFVSPQGEGVWTSVMMFYIRLAGCTVGKPYPKSMYTKHLGDVNILPIYTERCTLYDNRTFPCDTDYRVKERLTVKQLLERIPDGIEHVCITGGEPLMHDLMELVKGLSDDWKYIHIETSGTKKLGELYDFLNYEDHLPVRGNIWLTVSPKLGCLDEMLTYADEIKLLVDENFTLDFKDGEDKWVVLARKKPVYLQPINDENTIRPENVRLCYEMQKKYPVFRISLQEHKVLEMILKEHVR